MSATFIEGRGRAQPALTVELSPTWNDGEELVEAAVHHVVTQRLARPRSGAGAERALAHASQPVHALPGQ